MKSFEILTSGEHCEIYNITEQAREVAQNSQLDSGAILFWVAHTTCALTVIEWEEGHRQDICDWLEKYIPQEQQYKHGAAWNDDNGYAHMRAAFVGPDVTVPVEEGKLVLGTWQSIVLFDFDNKPRTRSIYYTLLSE